MAIQKKWRDFFSPYLIRQFWLLRHTTLTARSWPNLNLGVVSHRLWYKPFGFVNADCVCPLLWDTLSCAINSPSAIGEIFAGPATLHELPDHFENFTYNSSELILT